MEKLREKKAEVERIELDRAEVKTKSRHCERKKNSIYEIQNFFFLKKKVLVPMTSHKERRVIKSHAIYFYV